MNGADRARRNIANPDVILIRTSRRAQSGGEDEPVFLNFGKALSRQIDVDGGGFQLLGKRSANYQNLQRALPVAVRCRRQGYVPGVERDGGDQALIRRFQVDLDPYAGIRGWVGDRFCSDGCGTSGYAK
jgi:hypothetical protein